MNKDEALTFYKEYNDKCHAYNLALNTMSFDMSTIAPEKGNDYRIKMMGELSGELFDYMTDKENVKKLNEMSQMDLGEVMNRELELVMKDLNKTLKLPRDFFMSMQELYSKGEVTWRKARHENDYLLFKDTLKEIVEVTKQAYTYYGVKTSLYDDMLDDYEEGMNIEKYDEFFDLIKERLVPFVQKISQSKAIDDAPLHQHYSRDKQEKVMDVLKGYMNFKSDKCYMGESEHPFTVDFSTNDVRITTRYIEDSLSSSIFSIIHEYGHALYAMNVDESMMGLNVASMMSLGLHESQSRFLENYIGKRKSYWVNNYPKVQAIFNDQLKDVELDEFVKMINVSKVSLVRTEADELTYPLHIVIRYELEKEMINGEVDFDHLDTLWADKYEQYLGIRPHNAKEGILQDIHWSQGSFGYFPTYALGSAFAAQFFNAMNKDIDVDKALENNQFKVIEHWLKKHIQQYGALYRSDEILNKVCHQSFDPNVYIDYLIDKYSKLYKI